MIKIVSILFFLVAAAYAGYLPYGYGSYGLGYSNYGYAPSVVAHAPVTTYAAAPVATYAAAPAVVAHAPVTTYAAAAPAAVVAHAPVATTYGGLYTSAYNYGSYGYPYLHRK